MKKLIGLDILKIISMIMIFLFHSNIHSGIHFGIFNEYISISAFHMTLFFILSGCTISYSNKNKNLMNKSELKTFFIKRFLNIFPLYWLISIIYLFTLGKETLKQNILLFPIEALGFQSFFFNSFNIFHNGGTWFISCIIICYFLYPYIQLILNQFNIKNLILLLFVCIAILIITPINVNIFQLGSVYYNPFIRLLEFLVGALIISINFDIKNSKLIKFISNKLFLFLEIIILYYIVTLLVKHNFEPQNYTIYSSIALPFFILITINLLNTDFKKLHNSKFINFLSNIAYPFFLSQFWCFEITNNIFSTIEINTTLILPLKLIISFTICLIFSSTLYFIFQKKILAHLKKTLLKE